MRFSVAVSDEGPTLFLIKIPRSYILYVHFSDIIKLNSILT